MQVVLLDLFINKKCTRFDKIPIPPYHIQVEYASHIETIGRDKPMERPHPARHEELHHTHLWQESCTWVVYTSKVVQGNSTSGSFIVYSCFIDKLVPITFILSIYCMKKRIP